ncbi:MAG: M50 family metallopeptidase [Parasporobacterium sp.]|nr:M50 family metallopeptidase [Parasporobacterium sp.]
MDYQIDENTARKPILKKNISINNLGDKVAVFNSYTKKSYLFSSSVLELLRKMNGENDICALSRETDNYSMEEIIILVNQLDKLRFLDSEEGKKGFKLKAKYRLGAINGNTLFRTDSWVTKLYFWILALLSVPIIVTGLIMTLNQFEGPIVQLLISILYMPWYVHLVSFLIMAFVHEISHAAVARYYNVPVPEIGVMVFCLLPYVYTDLSFIRMLEKKSKRILCLSGGILSNLFLGGLSLCIGNLFDIDSQVKMFLFEFAAINMIAIILNLSVFFKLDGYFILEECLGEERLWERAIQSVYKKMISVGKGLINTITLRKTYSIRRTRETTEKNEDDSVYMFLYGLLCLVFMPLLLISFVWGLLAGII